ncbi:MAG: site-specific DNA-methyltransferase [Balneola sp.]
MSNYNNLFEVLGVDRGARKQVATLAKQLNTSKKELIYYNDNNILPSGKILQSITSELQISIDKLKIRMGIFDEDLINKLREQSDGIERLISSKKLDKEFKSTIPVFETERGTLYQEDCLNLMKSMKDDSVDLIFADPPFNLDKEYPSGINDSLKEKEYREWTENWLSECIRVLKFGGSLFVWNLPKWNTYFSKYLNDRLTFKHWVAVDIKYSLPIQGRLYPSHYSLLYYTKGSKPSTFKPDRLSMETCPHCYKEIKDYGGYKHKMNPSGINLTDVWYDIPPVRHRKYKARKGANELSIKLMDRIIEMATEEDDLVFDPFGGAGTTYIVSELKNRKWIGVELGPVKDIIDRFDSISEEEEYLENYRKNYNHLFPENVLRQRIRRGHWTPKTVRYKTKNGMQRELKLEDYVEKYIVEQKV